MGIKMRLCINSQTPFVRFRLNYTDLLEKYEELPDPLPLDQLVEGEDYIYAPGGVPSMVFPLIKEMMARGLVSDAQWVTLNPIGPERVSVDNITIHNVALPPKELASYAQFKEGIWRSMHQIDEVKMGLPNAIAYTRYNWRCAERMLSLLPDVDLFFVHDFQQLQVGAMLGMAAPSVFRWHIPLRLMNIPPPMRRFIVRSMGAFDSVIVSCKSDLEALIRAGYQGEVKQMYPYVNQRIWKKPSKSDLDEFCSLAGIDENDKVLLVVARMDKMKGQDNVIKAMRKIKDKNAKLVLVGNGSFSGSKVGGLAHPKSTRWRGYLEGLAREMGVKDRVVFTGYLPHQLVQAAYERCDILVLPSVIEGFGLMVLEGWLYKKPVVVSRGCGVSELVIEGVNGHLFDSGDVDELAGQIEKMLSTDSSRLGENGFDTAKGCYIDKGAEMICEVFKRAIDVWGGGL